MINGRRTAQIETNKNSNIDMNTHKSNMIFVAEQKGGDVRCEDGRVDDEDQDKPVPDGLERRIVKNGEVMDVRRL